MSQSDKDSEGVASRFLDALKGAIFVDDSKSKPPVKAASEPAAAAGVVKAALPSAQVATAQTNPMAKAMMDIVMSKTTAYTALMESIAPLAEYIPEEGARYKAAFAIVGKTRTVDQIVQAIDLQHLQALDAEVQRFHSQARNQEANEIESRRAEITSLQQSIAAANTEAERIRQQMEARLTELASGVTEAAQKIAQKESEISEKESAIARVNADFAGAVEFVKSTLLEAKAKVLRHLAG